MCCTIIDIWWCLLVVIQTTSGIGLPNLKEEVYKYLTVMSMTEITHWQSSRICLQNLICSLDIISRLILCFNLNLCSIRQYHWQRKKCIHIACWSNKILTTLFKLFNKWLSKLDESLFRIIRSKVSRIGLGKTSLTKEYLTLSLPIFSDKSFFSVPHLF